MSTLALGITSGLVAAVVAGAGVVWWAAGREAPAAFPEAEYELELPQTMLNAAYVLAKDPSGAKGGEVAERAADEGDARDVTAVVGRYELYGDEKAGTLVVSGMHGRFRDPDATREGLLKDAAGGEVAVGPKDFTPEGSDVTVTCQVTTEVRSGTRTTVPTCAWADGNTGATVTEIAQESLAQDPEDVDLEQVAATTLAVRAELRQPAG
ncbi:hypothetical protein [Streptomyces fructofermentans]|uniref:hypothetical protein n=1 Tax=Streptomyces fructofermentans TaxID=152141 RepID=UPI001E47BD08|nr:hypothetical protein [Streptomyces fructofermentans]